MNNLLKLSKEFKTHSASGPGYPTIPRAGRVTVGQLRRLSQDLDHILRAWNSTLISGVLVAVRYNDVVAKSNRIGVLLRNEHELPECSIVGARYETTGGLHHVITHYVSKRIIVETISLLGEAARVFEMLFGETVHKDALDEIWSRYTRESWSRVTQLPRSTFAQIVRDAYYTKSFGLNNPPANQVSRPLVTLYQTERDPQALLGEMGVSVPAADILDQSVLLTPSDYDKVISQAPYLVAMICEDFSKTPELPREELADPRMRTLPHPTSEPIIGVIDTPFEQKFPPYFSEWVEYHHMLSGDIPLERLDYQHGTSVSSLIVDAPGLNPELDDGCGHFRVRHFGVAPRTHFSSFNLIKKIETIISENRDIKVWNLSLGGEKEIEPNSISPEAAILDRIQTKYGVLFVVAGTNDREHVGDQRIGAPADSVNALVVNSVRRNGRPASYSRSGPVLHFHRKPDVSYYGGDAGEGICICDGGGKFTSSGTSLAAPLVARKAAFLIDVMGLSCEAAKALLIDSAAGWNPEITDKRGYGIVPINIRNVLKTPNDEIRFLVSGVASGYETYDYSIPVPAIGGKHPYVARATLCYFPECNRNQGVDYTSTELDLHFGRLQGNTIKSIKPNHQGEEHASTTEREAREKLRKWDNTKAVSEELSERTKPRKAYENPLWGIKIRKTSRYRNGSHKKQRFSLVVTLKELKGINRQSAFIQNCSAIGWTVDELRIESRVAIYADSQIEIEWN